MVAGEAAGNPDDVGGLVMAIEALAKVSEAMLVAPSMLSYSAFRSAAGSPLEALVATY